MVSWVIGLAVGLLLLLTGAEVKDREYKDMCSWDEEVLMYYDSTDTTVCVHRDFVSNEHMPESFWADERVR